MLKIFLGDSDEHLGLCSSATLTPPFKAHLSHVERPSSSSSFSLEVFSNKELAVSWIGLTGEKCSLLKNKSCLQTLILTLGAMRKNFTLFPH